MNLKEQAERINAAFDDRSQLKASATQRAVQRTLEQLDAGELRVAEPYDGGWRVNEWVKKAVLLYFPTQRMRTWENPPFEYHDKIPLKSGFREA